jgi:hypothetical protein
MKNRQREIVFAVSLAGLFTLLPLVQNPAKKSFVVRSGDTASYLAIRYYGFFSDSLYQVLKASNPHIADLNWIDPGDTLYFPPPKKTAAVVRREQLQSPATRAVITFLEGQVQYRARSGENFAAARPNLILLPGAEVTTGDKSRVELVLDDRSVLRLAAKSQLKIVSLTPSIEKGKPTGASQASFDFSIGAVWTKVTKAMSRGSRYELKLPTAVAGVQGTIYRASVAANGETAVGVYEGIVQVRGVPPQRVGPPVQVPGPTQVPFETWVRLVRANQELTVSAEGKPSEPRPLADKPQDRQWINWNQQRDRELDATI